MNLRDFLLPRPTSFRTCIVLLGAWCAASVAPRCAQAADLPPLTTAPDNPRIPGKFVWADLVTDNLAAAQEFYGKLFNWKFSDFGGYVIAFNDSRPVAGMFQRPRPKDRVAEPRWFGYISVPSVDRAKRAVTQAGGRVLAPPQRMPKRGEQAVFADPEGTVFGVVKSSTGDPEDFLAEPGDWIWIELLSRDARKAGEFYKNVAGYEIVENTTSRRSNDFVWVSKGYARAAALTLAKGQTMQPTWLPFVRVKDAVASASRAKGLAGKVLLEPKSDLYNGKLAVVADPTGAAIGLLEWSEELLKGRY